MPRHSDLSIPAVPSSSTNSKTPSLFLQQILHMRHPALMESSPLMQSIRSDAAPFRFIDSGGSLIFDKFKNSIAFLTADSAHAASRIDGKLSVDAVDQI